MQLFRDRARHESGVWPSVRLWIDLLTDTAISLPREYCYTRSHVAGASAQGCLDGVPTFFVFDTVSPGRRPLLLGGLLSLITLVSFPKLMNEFGNFRPPTDLTFAPSGAYEKQREEAWRRVSQREQSVGPAQPGSSSTFDGAARQRIIKNAIASIRQHHLDRNEAQEAADALLAHERRGDDDAATSTDEFASLLTRQMREATGSNELVLLYTKNDIPERTPGPEPPLPAAYRDDMQRLNCTFERVEILPHKIGYLKLNAFPDTSVCRPTATAAMAKLNDADALIFDLRDNRGGFPSMVSLLAAYLFDHPEYMYCPLENTTAESWTRSPVPGNKLADKPVYILTSSRTISAAEQFSYNLKMLKRGTLVGETTAGGGHAANLHDIGDHFYVGTIEVNAINPYGKSDWNDTGIEPDFKVKAPDALNAALGLIDKRLHVEQSHSLTTP
ncbi:MAG TPA: S41 family peptidase [Candidatus Sulfotelmatobacter sp.]|nr:S41 family peptidase [Candidatus Sulfotelmatobacter sp.]